MGYSYEIVLQGFDEDSSEWSDLYTDADIGAFHSIDQHYFYTQSERMAPESSGESGVSIYYFTYEKMKEDLSKVKFDFKEAARKLLNRVCSLEEYIERLQQMNDDLSLPCWKDEFMVWWEKIQNWRDSYRQIRIKFTVKV